MDKKMTWKLVVFEGCLRDSRTFSGYGLPYLQEGFFSSSGARGEVHRQLYKVQGLVLKGYRVYGLRV